MFCVGAEVRNRSVAVAAFPCRSSDHVGVCIFSRRHHVRVDCFWCEYCMKSGNLSQYDTLSGWFASVIGAADPSSLLTA